MRRTTWLSIVIAVAVVASACGSGPSPEAAAANRRPATTTTTEPPPEGVVIVKIIDGAFRPSNLELDLAETPVVQWRHEDDEDREYVIEARRKAGEVPFMSGTLQAGDMFEVDFSQFEPDIYRYFSFLGNTRIPGSVDTRPAQ